LNFPRPTTDEAPVDFPLRLVSLVLLILYATLRQDI